MLLLLLDNAAADPFNSVGEMRARARVCVCVCVWLKQSSAVAHILHVCVRVDVVVCVGCFQVLRSKALLSGRVSVARCL